MSEGKSGKRSKSKAKKLRGATTGQVVFAGVTSSIPLMVKLGFVYLQFKRKAKKAGRIFKKELVANGIDKNTAKLLTEEYLRGSHFLSQFDFSNMVKDR
ncbi:hypothetical protein [[Eubacterium] cellulosolvens]